VPRILCAWRAVLPFVALIRHDGLVVELLTQVRGKLSPPERYRDDARKTCISATGRKGRLTAADPGAPAQGMGTGSALSRLA
jgi:hypothetical protein